MPANSADRSRLRPLAAAALLAGLAGCAAPAAAPPAAGAPLAAGSARIWFYRNYEPSVSLNLARVALNGAPVADVTPYGGAIYRDVPPGRYHIAVDSEVADAGQTRDVELAAGQEAFVKIDASSSWQSGGDTTNFSRDAFYVTLMPPQVARLELR